MKKYLIYIFISCLYLANLSHCVVQGYKVYKVQSAIKFSVSLCVLWILSTGECDIQTLTCKTKIWNAGMHPYKEGIGKTVACHLRGLTEAQRIRVAESH